jgi:hypothetical protein
MGREISSWYSISYFRLNREASENTVSPMFVQDLSLGREGRERTRMSLSPFSFENSIFKYLIDFACDSIEGSDFEDRL